MRNKDISATQSAARQRKKGSSFRLSGTPCRRFVHSLELGAGMARPQRSAAPACEDSLQQLGQQGTSALAHNRFWTEGDVAVSKLLGIALESPTRCAPVDMWASTRCQKLQRSASSSRALGRSDRDETRQPVVADTRGAYFAIVYGTALKHDAQRRALAMSEMSNS